MIKVTIVTNTRPIVDIVDENTTPRQVFDEKGVDYATATTTIDGVPLGIGDLDKSFAEHGIVSECRMVAITKTTNA